MEAACRKELTGIVKGVAFDMDGTLVSSELDFAKIRAEGGVPDGLPILEFLDTASGPERERARRVLVEHENRAARHCTLCPGAAHVLDSLRERGLKLALVTRNSRDSVQLVIERFALEFDVWVAREDAAPKPSPEPILKIAAALGLSPGELLVVGDYVFDITAGRAAGALTALLKTNKHLSPDTQADFVLHDLTDLLRYFPSQSKETP